MESVLFNGEKLTFKYEKDMGSYLPRHGKPLESAAYKAVSASILNEKGEEVGSLLGDLLLRNPSVTLMEAHSQEAADLAVAALEANGVKNVGFFNLMECNLSICQLLGECGITDVFKTDILIIEHVVIQPKYRGKNLGLALLKRAMHHLIGKSDPENVMVFMKPFPLQFGCVDPFTGESDVELLDDGKYTEKWGNLEKIDFDGALQKLVDHFAILGFKRFGKSEFLYRDIFFKSRHPLQHTIP